MAAPDRPHTFPRTLRLTSRHDFADTYAAAVRRPSGPLLVFARPNTLGHHRLGMSVGRRVGNAPRRARIKRLLRESFRLDHPDLPGAYDLIVVVRPHEPLPLADYRRMLAEVVRKLDKAWSKRSAADETGSSSDSGAQPNVGPGDQP